MGWVMLGAIGAGAFAALGVTGLPRAVRAFALAALVLAAAGYAVQQRADLPGHPVAARTQAVDFDPEMAAFRTAIMPGTPEGRAALAAADAQAQAGDTVEAVEILLRAVRDHPRDAALWTGLGGALSVHDGGRLSPAAQFAFQRAWRLAPREPGPPFFLGLALAQSGDLAGAKLAWLRALTLSPRDAPYRLAIAERLAILDQFAAMPPGR